MKKLIAVLLALILVSNLALVWLGFENNRLLKEYLEGGEKIVSENEPEETPEQQEEETPSENADETVLVHISEDKYLNENGDWIFEFAVENTTEKDLFIKSLTFIDNGNNIMVCDASNRVDILEALMGPNFATTPLKPGETMMWGDGHPGENLTSRTYLFTFADENGTEYTATYEYNLLMEVGETVSATNTDYSSDIGRNLLTLRHDAEFEVQVADGVYWVPARTLGGSSFSNADIYAMLGEEPEVKQREITTLYEALQLYQVGNFRAADDNIRIGENGINWEHHKPGYFAVVTNEGCCATDSNWLNYILMGDYEEVGYIATSQRDGSGHIFNYIKHDGWYYFIDLTHYRNDWVATAVESGDLNDYYGTDFILGNIHKAKSVEDYVNYIQDMFGDPPGLMFMYTAENCLAIDSVNNGGKISIVYENNPEVDLKVVFDDPGDNLDYFLTDPPKNLPNWG